ncbi:MAG: hypothetical protein IKO57_04885 [Treponema sp.]|nr:hypothetical protein [Treponema sp.]
MKNPFFVFGRNRIFSAVSYAVSSVFIVFSAFAFFACSDELLSSPESSESSSGISASKVIVAPASLSATHGTLRGVQLSWKSSEGASRYKIYSADSPFSSFIQIGEASGDENFFTASENSGVSKYYKVKAVDSSLSESSFSNVAFGSSLATPIITSIEMGSDGTSATVKWWMENCTGETYESNVLYEISAYGTDRTTLVSSTTSSASNLSATITNLEPKTNYFFKVDAFLSTDQTSIESSDLVDKETARKLIPNPVENLCVGQGVSEDSVNLSFTLPEKCDVSVGNGAYEQHPLYFVISRKEKDKSDSSFAVIETVRTWDSSDYSTYIAGDTYSYSDSDVSRGKQYTYKIQSYVDDTKRTISSSDSIVSEDGWCISVPTLRVTSSYTKSDDGANFTSIMFAFASSFENFGKSYEYILKVEKSSLDDENAVSSISYNKFSTLSALNSFSQLFNNIDSASEGYYRYSLSVCAENASDAAESYTTVVAPGKYIVTNDATKLPQIENFTVEDGYKDKFVLKWKYNESYAYTIKWTPVVDGVFQGEETLELEAAAFDGVANGDEFSFEHQAVSGDRRIYQLVASNGLSVSASPSNAPSDSIFETLGTAKITLEAKDYDKISFTFPEVQKADGEYKISAHYEGSDTELSQTTNPDSAGYTTISPSTDGDVTTYRCTINRPFGYDDALVSGKPISLSLVAKSVSASDTTTAENTVRTMGPALANVEPSGINDSSITVKWSDVGETAGYIIHRVRYNDGEGKSIAQQSDTYWYDGNELCINGDAVAEKRAKVVKNADSTFTLVDSYSEADDGNSSYELNQSMISWGIPFGYVVIPVKTGGNSTDFSFDGVALAESSKVAYKNVSDAKGATYGYGLSVRAYKSENSKTQTLEWSKPYSALNRSLTPSVYYREAGSSANSWTKIDATLSSESTSVSFAPKTATDSYEYAIAYSKNSSSISLPNSFVTDSNTDLALATMETDGKYYNYSGVNIEKLNKGYLLAVDFSAGYGGTLKADNTYSTDDGKYYSEKVDWDEWNYDERSIGPTSAYISIKNYNLSSSWMKVATLDKDLHYSSAESLENTTVSKNGDVSVYLVPNAISTSESVSNGTMLNTAGPLMVLRDAKHYYQLTLVRQGQSETKTVTIGNDDSVYGYRQITTNELIRSAMIQMNDVMYKIGELDFDTQETGSGTISGSYEINHDSKTSPSYTYSITNYSTDLSTPGESEKGFISITIPKSKIQRQSLLGQSWSGSYPVSFDSTTITVKPNDSANKLETYSASIAFSLSSYKSASLSCNGTSISISSAEERRKWIPFKLHDDDNWYHENPSYGWWEQ